MDTRNLSDKLPKLVFTSLASHSEYYGDEKSEEEVIGILRVVLRQQVYPHVVRGLAPYRFSMPNLARRQIAKQVVLEICREEFMDDLLRNGDCLSAELEGELAVMAQSLCVQYSECILRGVDAAPDSMHVEEQRAETLQLGKDINTTLDANAANSTPQTSKDSSEMPEEFEAIARIMEQLGI